MFGRLAYARDAHLVSSEEPEVGQLLYARDLLEDLLNRAEVLEAGVLRRAFDVGLEERPGPEYVAALEDLANGVGLFVTDCNEARIRARRARLVCAQSGVHHRLVDGASVERDVALADVGGPLIPDPEA